jgi:hypothetical protein
MDVVIEDVDCCTPPAQAAGQVEQPKQNARFARANRAFGNEAEEF